jgi:hypothetical protein
MTHAGVGTRYHDYGGPETDQHVRSQSGRFSCAFTLDSHDSAKEYGRKEADEYDHEPVTIRESVS